MFLAMLNLEHGQTCGKKLQRKFDAVRTSYCVVSTREVGPVKDISNIGTRKYVSQRVPRMGMAASWNVFVHIVLAVWVSSWQLAAHERNRQLKILTA